MDFQSLLRELSQIAPDWSGHVSELLGSFEESARQQLIEYSTKKAGRKLVGFAGATLDAIVSAIRRSGLEDDLAVRLKDASTLAEKERITRDYIEQILGSDNEARSELECLVYRRDYLLALSSWCSQLPNLGEYIPAHDIELVHVSQQVTESKSLERPTRTAPPRLRIYNSLEEAISAAEQKNLLVLGGAGMGKSTNLRKLVLDRVTKLLEEADPKIFSSSPLPAYIPAAEFAKATGALEGKLFECANSQLADHLDFRIPERFFDVRAPDSPSAWLVVVDGIDEIFPADRRNEIIRSLNRLWINPGYRLIASTRPIGAKREPVWSEFECVAVQSLAPEARRELAQKIIGNASEARRFLTETEGMSNRSFFEVPLFLTLTAIIFKDEGRVPESLSGLFNEFVRERIASKRSFSTKVTGEVDLWSLFAQVASSEGHRLSEAELVEFGKREGWYDRSLFAVEQNLVANSVAASTGLLVQSGSSWAFIHQSFGDFFAARLIAKTEEPQTSFFLSQFDPGKVSWLTLEFVGELWAVSGKTITKLLERAFEFGDEGFAAASRIIAGVETVNNEIVERVVRKYVKVLEDGGGGLAKDDPVDLIGLMARKHEIALRELREISRSRGELDLSHLKALEHLYHLGYRKEAVFGLRSLVEYQKGYYPDRLEAAAILVRLGGAKVDLIHELLLKEAEEADDFYLWSLIGALDCLAENGENVSQYLVDFLERPEASLYDKLRIARRLLATGFKDKARNLIFENREAVIEEASKPGREAWRAGENLSAFLALAEELGETTFVAEVLQELVSLEGVFATRWLVLRKLADRGDKNAEEMLNSVATNSFHSTEDRLAAAKVLQISNPVLEQSILESIASSPLSDVGDRIAALEELGYEGAARLRDYSDLLAAEILPHFDSGDLPEVWSDTGTLKDVILNMSTDNGAKPELLVSVTRWLSENGELDAAFGTLQRLLAEAPDWWLRGADSFLHTKYDREIQSIATKLLRSESATVATKAVAIDLIHIPLCESVCEEIESYLLGMMPINIQELRSGFHLADAIGEFMDWPVELEYLECIGKNESLPWEIHIETVNYLRIRAYEEEAEEVAWQLLLNPSSSTECKCTAIGQLIELGVEETQFVDQLFSFAADDAQPLRVRILAANFGSEESKLSNDWASANERKPNEAVVRLLIKSEFVPYSLKRDLAAHIGLKFTGQNISDPADLILQMGVDIDRSETQNSEFASKRAREIGIAEGAHAGEEFLVNFIKEVRSELTDEDHSFFFFIDAIEAYAKLNKENLAQGIEWLLDFSLTSTMPTYYRIWAAQKIAKLGCRSLARSRLLRFLEDEISAHDRISVASALLDLRATDEGRNALLALADEKALTPDIKFEIAGTLGRHHLRELGVGVFEQVKDRAVEHLIGWNGAAQALFNLDRGEQAIDTLVSFIESSDVDQWERLEACDEVAEFGRKSEVSKLINNVIDPVSDDPMLLMRAAEILYQRGHVHDAWDILMRLLRTEDLSAEELLELSDSLLFTNLDFEAREAFARLIDHPEFSQVDRERLEQVIDWFGD